MLNLISFLQKSAVISVDHAEVVSKTYFNEHYGYPGKPVNFTTAFQNLPIKQKWTEIYLANLLSHAEKLEKLQGGATVALTLKEYLESNSNLLYYKTSNHLNTELRFDYQPPSIFDCWYASTKISTPKSKLSWLYIGNEGTDSGLHRDIWWTSAWNYLITGKKLWIIYPSTFTDAIYLNYNQYNINGTNIDFEDFLKFRYKPMVCVQESGDMIFVPGNCYHQVYNLERSISLTENFINETNYDLVRGYFRKTKNIKNQESIEAIVKEGFSIMRKPQTV